MPTYSIRGVIQACVHSVWTDYDIGVEMQGRDEADAAAAILDLEQRGFERRDPHALVRWLERPYIERKDVMRKGAIGDPGAAIVRHWEEDTAYFLQCLAQMDEAQRYQLAEATAAFHRRCGRDTTAEQQLAAWSEAAQHSAES